MTSIDPSSDIDTKEAPNRISRHFPFRDLEQQLNWIDWERAGARKFSALEALTAIGTHDGDHTFDLKAIAARLATPGVVRSDVYNSLTDSDRGLIDKATVLFSGRAPADLWTINTVPAVVEAQLGKMRWEFLGTLARDWQKSEIFSDPGSQRSDAAIYFDGLTLVHATGKSLDELAKDPAVLAVAGLDRMNIADRRTLLSERLDELGLSADFTVGSMEFSLAATVKTLHRAMGDPVPAGLDDKATVVREFCKLVDKHRADPESVMNPVMFAGIHLKETAGAKVDLDPSFEGEPWRQNAVAAATYFAERWNGNYGTPPALFDRVQGAYRAIFRETGWDDDDLDEKHWVNMTHGFGLPEIRRMSYLEEFFELADKPGVTGKQMSLKCLHSEKLGHRTHTIDPQKLLQSAEEQYNARLAQDPWFRAYVKEQLIRAGKEITEQDIAAGEAKLVQDFRTETEAHRHLVQGLEVLRDWMISQIPVAGNIYNIVQGIRHHSIKQIIGGGIGLTIEGVGIGAGLTRGGGASGLEAVSEAGGRASIGHSLERLGVSRSEFEAPRGPSPISILGRADPHQISLAADEVFSDMPARFQRLEPGEVARYTHPETGEHLTIARLEGADEPLALKPVTGRKDAYQRVDWTTGEPMPGAEMGTLWLDPGTGKLRTGGGLKGGAGGDAPGEAQAGPESSSSTQAQASHAPADAQSGTAVVEIHAAPAEVGGATAEATPPEIGIRLRNLEERAKTTLYHVQIDGRDTVFWDDCPHLSRTPDGWFDPPGSGSLTARLPIGPDLAFFKNEATNMGGTGSVYAYDGDYWTIPNGHTPAQRAMRVHLAVADWNEQYGGYRFGEATAWNLGDGHFAMRVPAIPFPDGMARLLSEPKGEYAAPPPTARAAEPVAPPDLNNRAYEASDRAVVKAGGHSLDGEDGGVYWYRSRYWTFQDGETVQQRVGNGMAAVERWNSAYSSHTGKYAGLRILPQDESVAVVTPGLSPVERQAVSRAGIETHVEMQEAGPTGQAEGLASNLGSQAEAMRWQEEYRTTGRTIDLNPRHAREFTTYVQGDDFFTTVKRGSAADKYAKAVAYAQTWNKAHAAEAGRFAIVHFRPDTKEVWIQTPRLLSSHVQPEAGAGTGAGQFSAGHPEISPAEPPESSGMPPRFQNVEPGEQRPYEHPASGETYTVTRIKSTDEVVLLRPVSGRPGVFQAVSWETGLTGGRFSDRPYQLYYLDRGTGLIEPGAGLFGGSRKGSLGRDVSSETDSDGDATQPTTPTSAGSDSAPPPPPAARTVDLEVAASSQTSSGRLFSTDSGPEITIETPRGSRQYLVEQRFQTKSKIIELSHNGEIIRGLDDYPELDSLPPEWAKAPEVDLTQLDSPLPGLRREALSVDGVSVGRKLMGETFVYEGEYWSIVEGNTLVQKITRAEAAVQRWNDQYSKYGFGKATVEGLQDNEIAIRVPAIPMRDGFAKDLSLPKGKFQDIENPSVA